MLRLTLVLLVLGTTSARANDSVATFGAGGLQLTTTADIAMVKEDLHIATDKITVDYVFRNRSAETLRHFVAFPMPEIPSWSEFSGDMPVNFSGGDNFMNFSVSVDGKPVTAQLEERALAGPIDVTAELTALGIPLNPAAGEAERKLSTFKEDQLKDLIAAQAVQSRGDGSYEPAWRWRATWYWLQEFPAGRDIQVSHSYEPATGGWFYYSEMMNDAEITAAACIDDGLKRAVDKGADGNRTYITVNEIKYILTTGGNWAGNIGDFRLTVDKGAPDNLVSFCGEGINKTGPTTFEMRKRDFHPTRDLDILIFVPLPRE
jgi:hypothetical protein